MSCSLQRWVACSQAAGHAQAEVPGPVIRGEAVVC